LALRALAGPVPADVRGTVDVLVDDARIRITAGDGAIDVALGSESGSTAADAEVIGDPETVLAVVSGLRSLAEARRSGSLRVTGNRTVARSVLGLFATPVAVRTGS
jgi:hypothetical protein